MKKCPNCETELSKYDIKEMKEINGWMVCWNKKCKKKYCKNCVPVFCDDCGKLIGPVLEGK